MNPKDVSRREMLRQAARVASLGVAAGCVPDWVFPNAGGEWPSVDPACEVDAGGEGGSNDAAGAAVPPTVVAVMRAGSVVEGRDPTTGAISYDAQPDIVQFMIDAALSALAGGVDNPWSVLLPDYATGMRVGLKVNCLNASLPTSPAVISAIIASLQRYLSIAPADLIVWDRRLDEMTRNTGYTSAAFGGARLVGTVNSTSDPGGPGYGANPCATIAGNQPRVSQILTEMTDVTINVPVLKTHGVSGVTGAMKNIFRDHRYPWKLPRYVAHGAPSSLRHGAHPRGPSPHHHRRASSGHRGRHLVASGFDSVPNSGFSRSRGAR